MKKIITGGSGLVGFEFKDGLKLDKKKCDLRDTSQVTKLFESFKPDYVIHTAAKVGGVGANMNFKGDFFYDNILMNTNIIHQSKQFNVKRLLCFLSTCIFPNEITYPLTEDKIHLGPPHNSNDAYAYAKRMVAVQIDAYNQQYGTDYFCVIPTNIYGRNDNYNLENGHVIPSIIHKCYLSIVNDTNLTLWGDGKSLREFIFAEDVAEICEHLLTEYKGNEPIIISNSIEYSIKYVAELITKIMGYKKKIIWDTSKPNGQYRKPSDNQRLKSVLPEYSFTPLETGLETTIDYFLKQYDSLRK